MADIERTLEQHLPSLCAFVRLRLGKRVAAMESVSDLVQSVCREVLVAKDRIEYQGEAAFRGWLFTAALRKIVAKDRYWSADKRDADRLRAATPATSDAEQRSLLDVYATFATPTRELAAREQQAAIEAAFATLSEPHREIISLAKIADLPHEEIARQLGITVEASRQLLRRALLRLAAALESRQQGSAG